MQRTCQRCGREAETGRFCRQCGAPLFAEHEATRADTRNYQSHPPPVSQTAPPDTPYTSPGYPPPAPPAPPSSAKAVTIIENLKYPNATLQGGQVRVFGTEVLKMHTTDDFDSVTKFYEDRLGLPTEENADNQKAVFISAGTKKTI